jgi:hypothetical protein
MSGDGRDKGNRAATAAACGGGRRPPPTPLSSPNKRGSGMSVSAGLPGAGLVGPRSQDDPQDLPDRDRGARLASGGKGLRAHRPPARSVTDHTRRSRGGVARAGRDGCHPYALWRPLQAGSNPRLPARPRLPHPPHFGHKRLSDLSAIMLQDFIDELLAARHSPSTIRNALLPLRAIYRRADQRGEVAPIRRSSWHCRPYAAAGTALPARTKPPPCLQPCPPPSVASGRPRSTPGCAWASYRHSTGPTSTSNRT